ncbi:tetratricopeptide repeat-containing glycosyltransferase family 2 protein [Sporosarcina beigongshangi]|uniref:tetratricopeptide repeat-containing glycosyltransferase family 2 protein n=1 Tax=Sporosarcina beigongshangi TaxID=2782538 RepID=UPI00193A7C16|nr:glycosyltransferase family 2 protein [Sporosarcina beigongshangi]
MITISLCMIVKNEEEVIGRCLESVSGLVDEIIIVDTGSSDRTKEIVKKYTNRIVDFQWVDDFAAARNFSFQQATQDYILWLDADDIFTEEDRKKFILLKQSLSPATDAVSLNYHLSFDEVGNVTSRLRRYRLVKRENHFQWIGAVHEFLSVSGNLMDGDAAVTHCPLTHDSERNLRIYRKLIESGETLSPRDTFYYANELMDHSLFEEASHYYRQFLDSKLGWVEDNIRACLKLANCYYELNDEESALHATLQTLTYDVPRPETCCRLGYYFMEQGKNEVAIHWYHRALLYEEQQQLSFQSTAFSTWLPHLQLCVLYDRLKQYEKAYHHNELARKYKPTDDRIVGNKKYLEDMLKIDNN